MKQGTFVGLDKNYNNIKVGDTIADEEGTQYIINSYGMAVAINGGGTNKLSELKGIYILPENPKPERKPKPEPEPEKPKECLPGFNRDDCFVADAPDEMLAAELRARGYEVTATKTIIINL